MTCAEPEAPSHEAYASATDPAGNLHPPRQLLHPGLTLLRAAHTASVILAQKRMAPTLTRSLSPPTQDTADYVKPVTFSVEYSLEDPDHGPMLDDGWPTALRVSVGPASRACHSAHSAPPTLSSSQKPRPRVCPVQRSSSPPRPAHPDQGPSLHPCDPC